MFEENGGGGAEDGHACIHVVNDVRHDARVILPFTILDEGEVVVGEGEAGVAGVILIGGDLHVREIAGAISVGCAVGVVFQIVDAVTTEKAGILIIAIGKRGKDKATGIEVVVFGF